MIERIIKELDRGTALVDSAYTALLKMYNHKPDSFTESDDGQICSEALDSLELTIGDLRDVITSLKEITKG